MEAFKTKIPTKLVVIKFKDLFALKFTRSLELYFCACPELSRSWWSWVSNWRLALFLSLTKPTVGTLKCPQSMRSFQGCISHLAVAVAVCCWNTKFLSSAWALHSSLIIYLEHLEIFIPCLNGEYSNIFGPKCIWPQIYSSLLRESLASRREATLAMGSRPPAAPPAWRRLQHAAQAELGRPVF